LDIARSKSVQLRHCCKLSSILDICAGTEELQSRSLPHEALLRLVNIAFTHLCGVVVTVLGRKKGKSRNWLSRVRRDVVLGGGRRFEDKVDLRLEGVQVFLSGPIEPSDGASQLPNFAVNEIAVEAKTINRINLIFPYVSPEVRDFLPWFVFRSHSV
jgi:hypothetical protein